MPRDMVNAPDGRTWYDTALAEAERRGRLEMAIERALGILNRNLGHQTEKCYDAVAVLNQAIRDAR